MPIFRKFRHRSRRNRRRTEARRYPHPAVGIKRNRRPDVRVPKPGACRGDAVLIVQCRAVEFTQYVNRFLTLNTF